MLGTLDALGVGAIALLIIKWLLNHTTRLTTIVSDHLSESTKVQTRLTDAAEHLVVVTERLDGWLRDTSGPHPSRPVE